MWLLIGVALVVVVVFAISLRAWIAILNDKVDAPECPDCRARMALTPTKGASGLAYQCVVCGHSDAIGNPARRWLGLRRPE
jgi:hypothetical protein